MAEQCLLGSILTSTPSNVVINLNNESSLCGDTNKNNYNTNKNTLTKDKHSALMSKNKKKRKLRLVFKKRNRITSDAAVSPPAKRQKLNPKTYQVPTKKKKKKKKLKTLRKKKRKQADLNSEPQHAAKRVIKLCLKPRNRKRKRHQSDTATNIAHKKRKTHHHYPKEAQIKTALFRYHEALRTNSDWLDSVQIGDIIEWQIPSIPSNTDDTKGKYVPVEILNRAYKAKIRYYLNKSKHYEYVNVGHRMLKNKNKLKHIQYIRPKHGTRENPQENPWLLEKLKQTHTSNTRCSGNAFDESSSNLSSLWVKKGKEIEIYIKKRKRWVIGKIVKMNSYFEFMYTDSDYVQNKRITKYGECIINNTNFRLPLQCVPFTSDLVDYNSINIAEEHESDSTAKLKRDTTKAIASAIRIYLGRDQDDEGLFEGSWCDGILYDIREEDGTRIDIFYETERMFKTVKWTSSHCLFYFPIRDIHCLKHWASERPICDCTTQMMEKLMSHQEDICTHKCYQCKVQFVYNDSLWFCPKENVIRHHKKCFYLCSRCVMLRPCIIIHIDEDKPRHQSNTRCSYRYERLVGNKGKICDSLQAPRILLEILHSFYHKLLFYPFDDEELIQLLDEAYLNIEAEDDDSCIIPSELQQLALQYLARSNLKALYYIYKAADYRYYHLHYAMNQSKYIPPLLQKNEIVIDETDSEDEPVAIADSEDEPLVNNENINTTETEEERTVRIKDENTLNINPYTSDEDSEIEPIISTLQVDPITANLNNHPALAMPALEEDGFEHWDTDDNEQRFNDEDDTPEPAHKEEEEEEDTEDDDILEDSDEDIEIMTPSPSPPPELRILPYCIPGPPPADKHKANWMDSVYCVHFNDDIAVECKAANYGLLSIESTIKKEAGMMMRGMHCKPKAIMDKLERDDDKILAAHVATYTAQQALEGEDVMCANTICIADEDRNNNEKRYNVLQERGINPWFPGDSARVYQKEKDIWLNGRVIETMWNPKAKYVLVHHYDMPWIIDKKYAIFSLDLVPVFDTNAASDLCTASAVIPAASNKRLLLIDRLKNGTPVKIWGPPWRYGRVLWRWNDGDLVCIQFNGQNIENCKTFHAHDKRWKITILAHDRPDTTGCAPPLSLKMAKSMDVTLTIDLVSSDSENDSENEAIVAAKPKKEEKKEENKSETEDKTAVQKKKRKKKVDEEDEDYLYDEQAKIDNVDDAQKFKELQDNFMEFIENEDDADIDKRGIIIQQAVEEEISKKYDLIEIVNVTNVHKEGANNQDSKSQNETSDKKSQNMIDFNASEYNEDGTRRFYRTRNRSNKINKIAKIKKYKLLSDDENNDSFYDILVYGIEEGSCFYPQQNILILWKFMNQNLRNTSIEFEINLMHKQYLNVIPKGKKRKKLSVYWDKIALLGRRHGKHGTQSLWIKCNTRGEFMYNTSLPKDIECNQDIYKISVCLKSDRNCCGTSFEFEVRSIICSANLQEQFLSALDGNKHKQHRITARLRADNEYDLRNKDYSKDNGVWCPCGAIATTREDYESDFTVSWVQCDECKTWQHIDCLQVAQEEIDIHGAYLCPWCNNTCAGFSIGELKPLFAKFMKTIWMLNEACGYRRKGKVIYGNSAETVASLNEKSMDDLKRLGLKRGLMGTHHYMKKIELISILTESPVFARTPNNLGKYISTLICGEEGDELKKAKVRLRLADLMAGNGNITQWLPGYHILAVEKNKQRYESGRRCVQRATWLNCDIFSEYFVKNYVFRCKPFDIVVSNPDFEFGFAAIYVGLLMIRGNPDAKLIYLLPMDFFNGTQIRSRLYRICNFHIEKIYSVGRWNYYRDRYFKSHPKIHCDCIYIIKPGKYSKFSCIMKQALIAKDLMNYQK